jgi:hypothetical protein
MDKVLRRIFRPVRDEIIRGRFVPLTRYYLG